MVNQGKTTARAYLAAKRLDREELAKFSIYVLNQVRGLLSIHVQKGKEAWEEPYALINQLMKEKESK